MVISVGYVFYFGYYVYRFVGITFFGLLRFRNFENFFVVFDVQIYKFSQIALFNNFGMSTFWLGIFSWSSNFAGYNNSNLFRFVFLSVLLPIFPYIFCV